MFFRCGNIHPQYKDVSCIKTGECFITHIGILKGREEKKFVKWDVKQSNKPIQPTVKDGG